MMKNKNKIFYLAATLLFLMSCNLFQSDVTPTPKINILATAVSQTLTAKPILPTTEQKTEKATATAEPGSTATVAATFTATTAPSIEPSPTPENMRTSLGTPTWQSQLDNGKSFGLTGSGYQDENIHIYVENSAMVLSSTSTIGYRSWRLTSPTPKDFYLDAVFKTVTCSGGDLYGLVYRAPDYSSGLGYYFGITCSGGYSLYKWTENGASVVVENVSPLIKTGNNQTNRIAILAKGDKFTFYINDNKVQEYTDSDLSSPGHFGAFIGGYSGNFMVNMDEISSWELH